MPEKQPKKICHIASIDITVKYLLMSQLRFLQQQGYEVSVVCSPGPLVGDIEKEGFAVEPIAITRRMTPLADVVTLWKLYRYFKKTKPDLVHTHAPKPALLGQWAAKLAGVPVIVNTVHGLYFTEDSSRLRTFFFSWMERIADLPARLVFSQNKEDIATMVEQKIVPAKKLRYLGNGIDTRRFNGSNQDTAGMRAELGIKPDVLVVGTVGRLVREKGYFDLFEAMREVVKRHPDAVLLCIGPEEPNKPDHFSPHDAKRYGLANKTVFAGERRDMEKLYPIMDVFVLASHREGFPRSVLEAMAMGKAIVATDIRGCREEITSEQEGLLVPVRNAKQLAVGINRLLGDKKLARRFAQAAQEKARTHFDEQLVFDRLKVEYADLLKAKP